MTKCLSCALFLVIGIGNPTGLQGTVSDRSSVEQLSGAALPPATPTPAIDAKGYFDSGQDFLRGKEYDKAIGALNEAIRLDPNFAAAYIRRGVAFAEQGNFGSAISDFNIAIRLDHNYTHAYYDRGIAFTKQGNFGSAISDFNDAIRLDHNDADAY